MKVHSKDPFGINGFFVLHTNDWLEKQRVAGKLAAKVLSHLEKLVLEGTDCTLLELDAVAEVMIRGEGAIPTFKGYKGFPNTVCCSVNNQLIHGIPTDYHLQNGDLVTFDVGVTIEGAIADTALTCIYGEPRHEWHAKLVKSTAEALNKGIAAISAGKRLGVIGNAIYKSAKNNSFNVINKYGGHSLNWNTPHSAPFVENKCEATKGFIMQPGLVLAIEPMLVAGSTQTTITDDGWTVLSNGLSAHAEHSVFIHEDWVEVITRRDNEDSV